MPTAPMSPALNMSPGMSVPTSTPTQAVTPTIPSQTSTSSVSTTSSNAPKSPLVVSTSGPAVNKLNEIKANTAVLDQGVQQQTAAKEASAKAQLQQEAQTIQQYGQAPPNQPVGALVYDKTLPQGYAKDSTGRIFKADVSPTSGTYSTASNQPTTSQTSPSGTSNTSEPSGANQGDLNAPAQDEYTTQLNALNKQSDDAYNEYKSSISQIQNGTFPLNPEQQAQVQALQDQFDALKRQQQVANQNYTSAITQAGIVAGRNRYAPEVELGNIQGTIDSGLKKIQDIDRQAWDAMLNLKAGFQDRAYKMVNEQYSILNDRLKEKTSVLQQMQKAVQDHADKMDQYNLEVQKMQQKEEQDRITNSLKFAEFDQKTQKDSFDMAMSSSKFDFDQKQAVVKNAIESEKLSWTEKQDLIKNALEQGKFSYQQEKDMRDYLLDVKKLEKADTTTNYKDWVLAGRPGTYADFLTKKVNIKPPTADEQKNAGFSLRVKDSGDTIDLLTQQFINKGLLGQEIANSSWTPNFLKSPEMQRMDQAQRDFVNALLRRESGAAIAPTEFESAQKQYFPQPGDSEAVLEQKKRNRDTALKGLVLSSGTALSDDFKKQVETGKAQYHSLDDYAQGNPNSIDIIEKIGQEHPDWSDDDILQILQSDQGGSDFNQEQQSSEKGSNQDVVSVPLGNKSIKVSQKISSKLAMADKDFFQATGKHLIINEGLRSHERQAELYQKYKSGKGGRAAPPGKSFHETGNAVDVANWKEAEPYLNKYGFKNPLADDKNHFSIGEFA